MYYGRVSTNSMTETLLSSLYANRASLSQLENQLSTDKKITTTSDDPSGASEILKYNVSLDKIAAYTSNISSASSELDATDSTLASLATNISDAKTAAQTGSTATYNHDQLVALKSQIDQIIKSVIAAGNTQYNGKYIFGGQDISTAPFTDVASTTTTSTVGTVTTTNTTSGTNYIGTASSGDFERNVTVGDGQSVTINITGDSIIGNCTRTTTTATDSSTGKTTTTYSYSGSGLLKTLYQLSDELNADPPDHDAIRSKIDELGNEANTVTNARAELGSVNSRLTDLKTQLSSQKTSVTSQKNNTQNIDMVDVISKLSAEQISMQASMKVTSTLLSSSSTLLSYLS